MKYPKPIRQKWFHHVGTLYVVKNKSTGELRMKGDFSQERCAISDSHIKEVFIWLGRYLAIKGKLPRHISLDLIAAQSTRTTKGIREVMAKEMFEELK